MAPGAIIANDPLRDFVLPIPTILGSARNYKLELPPGHSGLLMSRDKQTEGRANILVGVTDPDQQREVGQQVYNDSREKYVWNSDHLFANVLGLKWTSLATPA